jgi:hypothetical protein
MSKLRKFIKTTIREYLNEEYSKSLIKETAEEESWELVGQNNPVIQNYVKEKGLKNDEASVKKLIPIIEKLPTTEVSYNEIKVFKNLENNKNDKGLVEKMYKISKLENPRKEYKEFMDKRDSGENRNRGYDPVLNFDRIVKGDYEPPLVLKKENQYYVVGGRTRFYASIAAGKPIKIQIIE